MPIAHLPENTVLALGSSQVLTDSASVVKELVDNALDAHATSIVVEISANALDVIQVKDNGHGIVPEDRVLVCQRYCTSKIRDFNDVSKLGGTSLGFRGEALASAVEMSGCLSLITRVEGEAVAASLKFDRTGKILSQERTSHPVGTTVRIMDFLKHMPVRKQTALKNTKIASKIKDMLKAYVMARPSVRISMKVLKSNNDKDNFIYAAQVGATVTDAAMKVISQRLSAECEWHVWTSSVEEGQDSTAPSSSMSSTVGFVYTVESLLPRKQGDLSAISNMGQYLSVDSRPVSSSRGTMKQIITLFKAYLRSAYTISPHQKLMDPFMCLNIRCPPSSYDPNIEPAKDNVLFTDADGLLKAMEAFFTIVYGEKQLPATPNVAARSRNLQQEDFELLLNRTSTVSNSHGSNQGCSSRISAISTESVNGSELGPRSNQVVIDPIRDPSMEKRSHSLDLSPDLADLVSQDGVSSASRKNGKFQKGKAWKPGMYNDDDDYGDLDLVTTEQLEEGYDEEDKSKSNDVRQLNPWTIAKLNAPIRQRESTENRQLLGIASVGKQVLTPERTGFDRNCYSSPSTQGNHNIVPDIPVNRLLTPFTSPASRRPGASDLSSPIRKPFSVNPRVGRETENTLEVNTGIGEYTEESTRVDVAGPVPERNDITRGDEFVSARSLQQGTALADIPDISQRPRKQQRSTQHTQPMQGSGARKPFIPPSIKRSQPAWSATRVDPGPSGLRFHQSRPHVGSRNTSPEPGALIATTTSGFVPINTSVHPDLAITMDFESRKEAAMQRRKAQLHQQTLDNMLPRGPGQHVVSTTTPNSPHQNRYNKAKAALTQSAPSLSTLTSILEAGDPRGYLFQIMQRENREGNPGNMVQDSGSKRVKITLLPFETIPEGQTVHNLIMHIESATVDLLKEAGTLATCDEYVRLGSESVGSDITIDEAKRWDAKLHELIAMSFDQEGKEADVRTDLWLLIRKRRACHQTQAAIVD